MNPLILIAGLFALYEVLTHPGILSGMGASSSTATAPVIQGGQGYSFQQATDLGPSQTETTLIGTGIASGAALGTTAAVSGGLIAGGSALSIALPGIGVVAAAIFGALMAASAKRAAEARSENAAVAKEIPQWDAGVRQIVAAYNSGQITMAEAAYGLGTPRTGQQGVLWQAYWNVVGPQIQPGRNGCKSGTVDQGDVSFCGGNAATVNSRTYGAACCVGYDNLDVGSLYLVTALKQADANPGMPVTSKAVPTVYASKYGGINRPGYNVVFKKPAAAQSLFHL